MKKQYVMLHNPRCQKSRETLERLQKKGIVPTIVEYLKTPPSAADLGRWLKQLKCTPLGIVRTKEPRFKELNLKSKPPKTEKEWLKVLRTNPILIERPLVSNGQKAIIGRPPENVDQLFK